MTPDERWLATLWPFVQAQVPPAPARVVEIGCGPLGLVAAALLPGGPYFFCDLADTDEADEQAAIDAGVIQPTGIRYAGTLR